MAGRFFWYELNTTDLERSASFFAGLFDCDLLQAEDDDATFFLAPKGTESPIFRVLPIKAEEGTRSHWIGFLSINGLDQAIAQTEEAGGELHLISDDEEDRSPEDPRFAVVTDPQGAVVNFHEDVPGLPDSGEGMPEVGRLAWVELLTTDREAAAAYYRDLVGWEVGPEHARGDEGMAHALFRNGRVFGLLRDLPAGSPVPPHWVYYLRVDDLDQAMAHARTLGGFMYEDPAEVDGGRRVLMLDPTGAPVALWAPR